MKDALAAAIRFVTRQKPGYECYWVCRHFPSAEAAAEWYLKAEAENLMTAVRIVRGGEVRILRGGETLPYCKDES